MSALPASRDQARRRLAALCGVAVLVALGCHSGGTRQGPGAPCGQHDDCRGGALCIAGRCEVPPEVPADGGQDAAPREAGDAQDSGEDAPSVGPQDAPAATSDAGPSDAGPSDAGPSDAGPSDAGLEAPALVWDGPCTGPPPAPAPCPTVLWPGGVIPYVLDPELEPALRDAILASMADWNLVSRGRITFLERQGERDYVHLVPGASCDTGCPYGNLGGEQLITIASPDCVAHRLGHVIGLGHEHQRYDRDRYLAVNPASSACLAGSVWQVHAFSEDGAESVGEYVRDSVMQHPSAGDECQAGPPEELTGCQITRRAPTAWLGAFISPETTPAQADGAKVVELYSTQYGPWTRSRSLGLDIGQDQPLSPAFAPPNVLFGPCSTCAPTATWKDGQTLYLFIAGEDDGIWYRVLDFTAAEPTWSAWRSLGSSYWAPSAATYGGRPFVCALGFDGIWCRQEISAGNWQAWEPLGRDAANGMALGGGGSAPLTLAHIDQDGAIWTASYNGRWGSWSSMPGPEGVRPHSPVIASGETGTPDLFVMSGGNCVWHARAGGWEPVICEVSRKPTVVSAAPALYLYTESVPLLSTVEVTSWYGEWGAPRAIAGTKYADPGAAVRSGDGRVDLFSLGSDLTIWHRWRLPQ